MKNTKKKGFTIVELVIVIAIIAILAAVLIPTFASIIHKANISADTQLCKNMNTALSMAKAEGQEIEDMEDVLYAINQAGYIIENLNPTTEGYYYAYDTATNQILFISDSYEVYYSNSEPGDKSGWWVTVGSSEEAKTISDNGMGVYLENDIGSFEMTTLVNIDTGAYKMTGKLTINNATSTANITLYGEYANVEINAPEAEIAQFGHVDKLTATAVKNATLKINGTVDVLVAKKGHIEITPTANVKNVVVAPSATTANTVKVTNKGEVDLVVVNSAKSAAVVINNDAWIKEAKTANATQVETIVAAVASVEADKTVDAVATTITNNSVADTTVVAGLIASGEGKVEITTEAPATFNGVTINNRSDLEAFRDAVNKGRTYKGLTVTLAADIDLSGRAWTPIGNFTRKIGTAGSTAKDANHKNGFQGIFDGNNHTISNLSNEGFSVAGVVYQSNKSTPKDYNEFIYGLFGCVINAEIKNLNMTNVNLNVIQQDKLITDSVAAIVGYAGGESFKMSNCSVSGVIKGYDSVAGLVGRIYAGEKDAFESRVADYTNVVIENCVNNATVNAWRRAAGIVGYSNGVKIMNCTNKGNISNVYANANDPVEVILDKNGAVVALGASAYHSASSIISGGAASIVVTGCENSGTVTSAGKLVWNIQGTGMVKTVID